MIGTISDDGRALGCPHIQKARLPQTPAGVVHRVPWLRARVHLPETVTTMYCWDAGDGVGAPAGCEGVGAAGQRCSRSYTEKRRGRKETEVTRRIKGEIKRSITVADSF